MRFYLLTFVLFIVFTFQISIAAEINVYDLGHGYSISIPNDWNTKGKKERTQYLSNAIELSQKTDQEFLVDPTKSSVPLQALKEFEEGVTSVMVTVGPPELRQAELTTWEGEKIKMLGQLLGETHSKVLAQANCKEIKYSPASKIQISDIQAVYFILSFNSPEGKKRIGEKYYIYTEKNTLIITVEYPEGLDLNNDFLNIKQKILNSFTITSPETKPEQILELEKEVKINPQNVEAWTKLGNVYYDTHNFAEAIYAYNKSLEINSNNPNVLTDLGVMYRKNGQPEKALEMFDRAIAIAPSHIQAWFNKGILLRYDLNDREGAVKSWEEVLKINPNAQAPNGQLIRDMINQL